eukprot:710708-Prymnesium_polylepis.1
MYYCYWTFRAHLAPFCQPNAHMVPDSRSIVPSISHQKAMGDPPAFPPSVTAHRGSASCTRTGTPPGLCRTSGGLSTAASWPSNSECRYEEFQKGS